MRTHICLLSDQPVPNVCPLVDRQMRADHVVFVTSPQRRHTLDNLKQVLSRYHIGIGELPIERPYGDIGAMREAIETEIARRRQAGQEVLVNATGGTKPMSIAAHMAASNAKVPAFYVNDDRIEWLYLPLGDQRASRELEERLNLPDFLSTFGFESKRHDRARPEGCEDLLQELLRHGKPTAYAQGIRALNFHAARDMSTLVAKLDPEAINQSHLQAVLDLFKRHGLLEASRDAIRFKDKGVRAFCAGSWLEGHVLDTINDLRGELGRKLNDLCGNLEVSHHGARKLAVKNELDVAILHDNTLHIVECKTRVMGPGGGQAAVEDAATDALYKLATLKRELGGIRAKAMLVSYQPVESWHRARAALLDIDLVAGDELRDLRPHLKKWLTTHHA